MSNQESNVPPLDAARGNEGCDKGLLCHGLSSRCLKDEIIQELGRTIVLLGGKSDILSTVWSIGSTIEDDEALYLLKIVNDSMPKMDDGLVMIAQKPLSP